MDLFGVPVQLTYNGERTFRTCLGGCVSLVLVVVILFGSVY